MDVFLISSYEWQFAPELKILGFYKDSQEGWAVRSQGGSLIIWKRDPGWRKSKEVLEPSLEDYDPYLLHDMDKAVERIRRTIEEGKTFSSMETDADGMTSAWLWRKVWSNGAECRVYVSFCN